MYGETYYVQKYINNKFSIINIFNDLHNIIDFTFFTHF